MHALFSPIEKHSRASAWRFSVLMIVAALSFSQGCGLISDTPNRVVSTRAVSFPPSDAGKSSIAKPRAQSLPQQMPVTAKLPSPPEADQTPPIEGVPSPTKPIVETGVASWYGPGFQGKLTASGEVFNQEKFTAAHRTLPWGSRVKVTNLANGKSAVVRINDRGPAVKGRILDVSRAAARALGMVDSGTTTVRVEWLPDSEQSNELASGTR